MEEEQPKAPLISDQPAISGQNLNPAVYESRITPLLKQWRALLKRDDDIHKSELEEIFTFLREVLTSFPEQLVLFPSEEGWNTARLFRMITAEILAKGVAYRDLQPETDLVPIPVALDNGEIICSQFTVEKIPLPFGNDTLFAYGLRPEHPELFPPILLFRGTTPYPAADTMQDTLLADTCPTGAGWDVLFEGKGIDKVAQWLHHATEDGRYPAVVAGHSLAGALTQMVCAHLPRFVGEGFAFNSPGVSPCTHDLWHAHSERPFVCVLNREKDLVSLAGARFIGDVYEARTHQRLKWVIHAHSAHNECILTQKTWALHRVDHEQYCDSGLRGHVHQLIRRVLDVGRPLISRLLTWGKNDAS